MLAPTLSGSIHKLYLKIVWLHLENACKIWDPHLAKDCLMIASRVRFKQWTTDTRYQDMLEFLNVASLDSPQETAETVHIS